MNGMISLKKFFILLSLSIFLTSAVSCNKEDDVKKKNTQKSSSSVADSIADKTENQITQNTINNKKPDISLPENISPAKSNYVMDDAKLLSADELSMCNNYAEWIYKNYLINIYIATADNLGELSPHNYAQNIYNEQYGGLGSGMVILINNATNNDYIYKQGRCETIDSTAETSAFLSATKTIINYNSYGAGIIELMKLAESLPQHICDNAGLFKAEEISMFEELCKDKNVSLLITKNSSSKSDEEICREYFDRRFTDTAGSANTLILLNTVTGKFTVISDSTQDYQTKINECNKLIASKKYLEACKSIISFFTEQV